MVLFALHWGFLFVLIFRVGRGLWHVLLYRSVIVSGVSIFHEDRCRGRVIVVIVRIIFGHHYNGYPHVTSNTERDQEPNAAKYRHQVALCETSATRARWTVTKETRLLVLFLGVRLVQFIVFHKRFLLGVFFENSEKKIIRTVSYQKWCIAGRKSSIKCHDVTNISSKTVIVAVKIICLRKQ